MDHRLWRCGNGCDNCEICAHLILAWTSEIVGVTVSQVPIYFYNNMHVNSRVLPKLHDLELFAGAEPKRVLGPIWARILDAPFVGPHLVKELYVWPRSSTLHGPTLACRYMIKLTIYLLLCVADCNYILENNCVAARPCALARIVKPIA
jgi:hypothetical protein